MVRVDGNLDLWMLKSFSKPQTQLTTCSRVHRLTYRASFVFVDGACIYDLLIVSLRGWMGNLPRLLTWPYMVYLVVFLVYLNKKKLQPHSQLNFQKLDFPAKILCWTSIEHEAQEQLGAWILDFHWFFTMFLRSFYTLGCGNPSSTVNLRSRQFFSKFSKTKIWAKLLSWNLGIGSFSKHF